MKSFYLFKTNWFYFFDKLVDLIENEKYAQFTIWRSKKKDGESLIILYGTSLKTEWQSKYDLKEISESEFQLKFKPNMNRYSIHGYNEFNKIKVNKS